MASGAEIVILVAIAIFAIIAFLRSAGRKSVSRRRYDQPRPAHSRQSLDLRDAHDQLRIVTGADFVANKVMNAAEYRVFKLIEDQIRRGWPRHRVFSQTSLGEIIRSADRQAHSCINSKRVDVLVISPAGLPVLVAEYQGSGHYQHHAPARDAVKKEALRKAGVLYLEIPAACPNADIVSMFHQAMARADANGTRVTPPLDQHHVPAHP